MSLRPEIRGFDLARFKSLFCSRDDAVVSAIEAEFERAAARSPRDLGDAYREAFREALRRAIREGIPFADLDVEGPPHVRLAVLLAGHDQDLYDTGSNVWKVPAFIDFYREYAEALDPRGRTLLGCFLKGRPVFGKKIGVGWSYYGYLNRSDAGTLRSSLSALQEREPRLAGGGMASDLVADFTGWLAEIDARGQDLWFWTA
jgi:hypothetical protein